MKVGDERTITVGDVQAVVTLVEEGEPPVRVYLAFGLPSGQPIGEGYDSEEAAEAAAREKLTAHPRVATAPLEEPEWQA